MIKPTLEEARRLLDGNTLIPIALELLSDVRTPIEVLKLLQAAGQSAYILESVERGESWGRYTFLGFNPSMEIAGNNNAVTIKKNGKTERREGNPHRILQQFARGYKSPRLEYMPTFTGGFVGYFAYDYIKHIETSLQLTDKDDIGFDDFRLMLFDKVIAFDQFKQKIYLIVNIGTDDLERNYIQGVTVLKDMEQLIFSERPGTGAPAGLTSDFSAAFTKEDYCNAVAKAKEYIFEGDIFQCVPSNRFRAAYQGDLLQAYRVLRTTSPSAYMFYIQFDDMQVAGASPETLVSLTDGIVSTYPLAGTCRRTPDEAENARLIEELLKNEKELAEHDMLVDLSRNDLGKICEFGTVQVGEYKKVKKCSHVCHIASKVTGQIKESFDAFDAIAALIPGGTLSGAPKKRACEIIDEIERVKRGVYGGAVGYIDFTGNMDLCIGIRMAVLKDNYVYVQAGAGIVADSIPENEYQECLNKAGAMMEALAAVGKAVQL